MSAVNSQQVMALAAVCHASSLVQQVARTGDVSQDDLNLMLSSIIELSPEQPQDVYQNQALLDNGYQLIKKQLGESKNKDVELTRYIVGLLALERKLSKNTHALNGLSEKLNQMERQLAHFDITDDSIIAAFADVYSEIVSPLGQRIQIVGNPTLLQQKNNQHKIRALLLSGIRAAVLWRQLGGKRRHILLSRKRILQHVK